MRSPPKDWTEGTAEELLELPAGALDRATIRGMEAPPQVRARVKFPYGGRIPGQVVTLQVDATGTPLDDAWRRALEGGVLEIIQEVADAAPAGKPAEKRSSR